MRYSSNSDDFQKAMNDLYESAYTVYWRSSPVVCTCNLGTYVPNLSDGNRQDAYDTDIVNGVTKLQQCSTASIQTAYGNYTVSADDIGDFLEYLDYFGDIEDEYKCSGVCNYEVVYYFSNTLNGRPEKECYVSIKDELLLGEMRGMGIGFIVSGIVLLIVIFIQYGLWCREEPKKQQQRQQQRHQQQPRKHKYVYAGTNQPSQPRDFSKPPPSVPTSAVSGANLYLNPGPKKITVMM